ncbi:Collectin-12 [Holothuria leucospilota]|uniref:Collectin-12 n=1 Tax=Holothuria leucospilota TaxID=206669 RepID=A0A9Q1BB23_HOLLE|nr:Collectin-12 [Holothuria leucospilota]
MSSHLVFIESYEEQQFLSETYNSSHAYWLGLNGDSYSEKTWDDGSVMVYSRIGSHATATDNNSGCYRIITDAQAIKWEDEAGSWFDKSCDARYGYICEYEMGA